MFKYVYVLSSVVELLHVYFLHGWITQTTLCINQSHAWLNSLRLQKQVRLCRLVRSLNAQSITNLNVQEFWSLSSASGHRYIYLFFKGLNVSASGLINDISNCFSETEIMRIRRLPQFQILSTIILTIRHIRTLRRNSNWLISDSAVVWT